MSDLIDRYLGAVAALLPKASRQDIVAELRDLIMNRVEDKEGQLGRPLDKREIEDLLREIGHPIAVAGRYGPARALVGAELYPFWLFAVKVLLAIAAIAAVVPAAVLMVTGKADPHMFNGIVSDFLSTGLKLVGFATLMAAAIERGWLKLGDLSQWKASELPYLPEGRKLFAKSRFDGVFELAAIGLFIAWWTGGLPFPMERIVHTDRDVSIVLNPSLSSLYWPILVLAVLQGVSALILVAKPGWVRTRAATEMACALGGLALVAVLWPAQPLLTFTGDTAGVPELQKTMDLIFQVVMVVAAATSATKLVVDGLRLARGR